MIIIDNCVYLRINQLSKMAKIINIIGQKFGKLTVINMRSDRGNSNQIMYDCKCDCGNNNITSGESIRSGKSKSCGCNRKNPPNKENDRIFAVWKQLYKSTIEKRNKKRNVTITDIELNDFILLSKSNCFYCGSEPLNKAIDRHRKTNEERCTVDYNGLDRIDSNFGYFKDNVVPCCKHCNTAKNTMTKEEFLKWVKKIYEHNFR